MCRPECCTSDAPCSNCLAPLPPPQTNLQAGSTRPLSKLSRLGNKAAPPVKPGMQDSARSLAPIAPPGAGSVACWSTGSAHARTDSGPQQLQLHSRVLQWLPRWLRRRLGPDGQAGCGPLDTSSSLPCRLGSSDMHLLQIGEPEQDLQQVSQVVSTPGGGLWRCACSLCALHAREAGDECQLATCGNR
jgi:hypothetical protein